MKFKKILLAILCLSLNCALANDPQLSTKQTKNNNDLPLIPGWGYDSALKQGTGTTPLKNASLFKTETTNPQTSVDFSDKIDLQKIAFDLNLDFSAAGGWKDFSGSMAANYLIHVSNTDYSENFTYAEKYSLDAALNTDDLLPRMLGFTAIAKSICNNDPTCKDNIEDFTQMYGDNLITNLTVGGLLLVNFHIDFSSAYLKQQFDHKMQGKIVGLISATDALKEAVELSQAKGSLEFSAYQLGGDPQGLARIFQKAPGGNYYITTCSLDKLDDCRGIIQGVIDYANKDFTAQFTNPSPNKLAALGKPTKIIPYATLFHIAKPMEPSPEVKQAQTELLNLYHDMLTQKTFVDHISNSQIFVSQLLETTRNTLKATKDSLDYNVQTIHDQAMNCYTAGMWQTCPAVVANINAQLRPFDSTIIPYLKQAYLLDFTDQYQILLGEDPKQPGIHHVASFERNLVDKTNIDATWQFLDDGQTLKAEGIDKNGNHSYGTFKKDFRGCYTGIQYVQTASPHDVSFCPQDNNPFN